MYFFKSIVKTYPEELPEVEGCGLWGAMGTVGCATAGLRGILEGVGLLLLLLLSPSVLLIAVKEHIFMNNIKSIKKFHFTNSQKCQKLCTSSSIICSLSLEKYQIASL